MSDQGNHKLTDFVNRYIHFHSITKMGKECLAANYCAWAKEKGYRLNERKAAQIFAIAQDGIPTLSNSQSTTITVVEAIKLIRSINESCIIIAQMQEFCKYLPEYS